MKTAIYVEDGILQVVLTPETNFEKEIFKKLDDNTISKAEIMNGSFYHCNGGWIRQKSSNVGMYSADKNSADCSLILRINEKDNK
jgi:hypothetical protein